MERWLTADEVFHRYVTSFAILHKPSIRHTIRHYADDDMSWDGMTTIHTARGSRIEIGFPSNPLSPQPSPPMTIPSTQILSLSTSQIQHLVPTSLQRFSVRDVKTFLSDSHTPITSQVPSA